MDPATALAFIKQQVSAITAAPYSFFAAMLVLGFALWRGFRSHYRGRLESKDALIATNQGLIASKQGEIDLLERQLDQAKSDLEISKKEPAEMARMAANWADPLREDFEELTSGQPLTLRVPPQSEEEMERLLHASYLLRLGLADLQQPGVGVITIQSSAAATDVREEYDKLGEAPDEEE